MAISALPTVPISTMSEEVFDTTADAFLGALPTFRTEANALAVDVQDDATTAATQAGIATTQAGLAAGSAGEAAASAVAASAFADDASAFADSAALAANSTLWISAGTYVTGQLVYSPIDFETYRAITNHNSIATDPSADATNWLPLNTFDGDYDSLTGKPTIPTLAAIATAAQVRSLTTATTMTPEKVRDAAAAITPSGGANYAPDWEAVIAAEWVVTGNRVLSNPTNVIPGKTIAVTISATTSTDRTITFGSYYRGDLPDVVVDNAKFVTLFLHAISSTQILVSDKAWT